MPIYMDVHIVPGVKARDVAEAHHKDLMIQGEHECTCITYWIDEERETIFCLIEAPTKDAVNEMHGKAHGLIPNKIIEVSSTLVDSFLGRIYDPVDAEMTTDGLKVFKDPSFRVILLLKTADPALLKYKVGEERAEELLNLIYATARKNLRSQEGREVEERGPGFIGSFSSASAALSCALAIQKDLAEAGVDPERFRMAIHAGEPVAKSDQLFGDTIQLTEYMCNIGRKSRIMISSAVDELTVNDFLKERRNKITTLGLQNEALLRSLFNSLEANWQNPEFNVSDFCQSMAMSKSQLYRKTITLCDLSPVNLLKDFRLEKARELLKKQRHHISEITFDSGFTSPSYFTKCFKKKYGLLPMAYLDLLH